MSISAISSSILNSATQTSSTQNQFQAEFQQLSKDLQSGNLSAAQTDFATLQKDLQGQGGAGPTNGFHHIRNHHLKDEGSSGSSGSTSSSGSGSGVAGPPIQVGGGPFPLPPLGAPPTAATNGSATDSESDDPFSILA